MIIGKLDPVELILTDMRAFDDIGYLHDKGRCLNEKGDLFYVKSEEILLISTDKGKTTHKILSSEFDASFRIDSLINTGSTNCALQVGDHKV
jgi:hypothetical protein